MPLEESYNRVLKGPSSALRKLAVCTFVGATFSLGVFFAEESLRDQWAFGLGAGAAMGLTAGSFLVLRDALRNRNLRWRVKCEERARHLQEHGGARDPAEALRSAQAQVAEETSGCIVWTGMILGGFILLCGAIMLVVKIVEAARRVL